MFLYLLLFALRLWIFISAFGSPLDRSYVPGLANSRIEIEQAQREGQLQVSMFGKQSQSHITNAGAASTRRTLKCVMLIVSAYS